MSTLCKHNIFDFFLRAELFLESDKLVRQSAALLLRDTLKGVFVQNLGSFVLSLSYFELGELDEELLVEGSLAKLSERTLEIESSFVVAALVLFEVRRLNIA